MIFSGAKRSLIYIVTVCALFVGTSAYAGNPERSGQAGGTQLLVNPYARSSGLGGLNVSYIMGPEAMINNVAGLALTRKTELVFSNASWLRGSDIGLNSIAFGQKLGESGGVIGFQVMAYNLGDLTRTTIDNPDGNLGTFSPNFLNIGVSYAKEMVTDRIFVGATVKVLSESIPDVNGNGFAFDGGVQYKDKDGKFRLGVALRNIGPTMQYSGDGLKLRTQLGGANSRFDSQVSTVPGTIQLPTQLLISASYNMGFGDTLCKGDIRPAYEHELAPMFTFVSNAFSSDQYGLGLEYSYRRLVYLRASYSLEDNIGDLDLYRNANSGLTLGGGIEIPFKKRNVANGCDQSTIGVDYSYRHTHFFQGVHSFGFRFAL